MSTTQKTALIAQHVAIEWAKPGERARKIVRRSNLRVTGKFPSFRNNASVHWESFTERDCVIRLDADPRIDSFKEQPATLTYVLNGKTYRHFPDLFVVGNGRAAFIEVKSHTDPDLCEAIERGNALRPALLMQGFDYFVVTDLEIRHEPQFSDAKLLLQLGRNPVSDIRKEQLRRFFLRKPPRWRDIVSGSFGENAVFDVCRLLLEGYFSYDRRYALSADSVINATPFVANSEESSTWL
tara:strand:+ start:847348 stop:848064 length:717 start_codon:yes stop_codon:yes gene_type:complete